MGNILLQLLSPTKLRLALARVGLRLASAYSWVVYEHGHILLALRYKVRFVAWATHLLARVSYFFNEWVLTTNHRKIAILYFAFVAISGFTGLILATIIRLELAYPGQFFLTNNAERYLTVISLHGIVMVFFFVIPTLFGAFGNFLLPTQLGIRDVAFPRLNSFMFWVTPAGFVMLLHILMFDKSYSLTYWINYSETKAQLRRRYDEPRAEALRYHQAAQTSVMAWRFNLMGDTSAKTRALLLKEAAPALTETGVDALATSRSAYASTLAGLQLVSSFLKQQLKAGAAAAADSTNAFTLFVTEVMSFTSAPFFFEALKDDLSFFFANAAGGAAYPYSKLFERTALADAFPFFFIDKDLTDFDPSQPQNFETAMALTTLDLITTLRIAFDAPLTSSGFLANPVVDSAEAQTLADRSILVFLDATYPLVGLPTLAGPSLWEKFVDAGVLIILDVTSSLTLPSTPEFSLEDLPEDFVKPQPLKENLRIAFFDATTLFWPLPVKIYPGPLVDNLILLYLDVSHTASEWLDVLALDTSIFGGVSAQTVINAFTHNNLVTPRAFVWPEGETFDAVLSVFSAHPHLFCGPGFSVLNPRTGGIWSQLVALTAAPTKELTAFQLCAADVLLTFEGWLDDYRLFANEGYLELLAFGPNFGFNKTGWADTFLATWEKVLTFEHLQSPSLAGMSDPHPVFQGLVAEIAHLGEFGWDAISSRLPVLSPQQTLAFEYALVAGPRAKFAADYSMLGAFFAEFELLSAYLSELRGVGECAYGSYLVWAPLRDNENSAELPVVSHPAQSAVSFFQTDAVLANLNGLANPQNAVYGSALKPSLRTYTFNGDLFSAAWELRQLWLARQVSLRAPKHFTILPELDFTSFDSNDLDRFIGLTDLQLVREVIRLEIEDSFYLASVLFSDIAFNLNVCFGYDVAASLQNTFAYYVPGTVKLRKYWAGIDASFWEDHLNFFLSPEGRLEALRAALAVNLFAPDQTLSSGFHILAALNTAACHLGLTGEELFAAIYNPAPLFGSMLLSNLEIIDQAAAAFTDPASLSHEVRRLIDTPVTEVWARLSFGAFPRVWKPEAHLVTVLNPNTWATDTLFGVSWPSTAFARPSITSLGGFVAPTLGKTNLGTSRNAFPSLDTVAAAVLAAPQNSSRLFADAAYRQLHSLTTGYCLSLWRVDLLNDWRELKLEREVWRSIDTLAGARNHLMFKKKYYSNFYEPGSLVNKVSTWLPNHLLPGWAFVTPYSSRLRYTALGKVDVALVVVFAASLGSIFSSVNYVITYRYIGAPTLKNRRELRSFFVDALLVASRMMILANPALMIGILLLLSDRHFNTSVFDFSGGGDTILFQHLFWFFGHPEVYIIIIPCFGIVNSLLPYYLKKRLSGRLSLQFSMYTIAYMSFAVWGHHMYMVGLANSARTLYSTMTVMISVPASTKVIHWCVTLIESTLTLDVGFLFLLSFMYFFVLGGLSGMFVAHIGFDTIFHDTFYVIGHFHVMFAGAAVCCIFAAFYFYFPAIFGVRYSKFFAYLHYGFYMAGQLLTLIPMFWLGYSGMPRRIMDYPSSFGGWHSIISSGHILTVISFIFFLAMLMDSFYEGRAPITKTKGVSRLNTRLAFYLYESRKLQAYQTKSLPLLRQVTAARASRGDLYKFCWKSEMTNFEYVFSSKPSSLTR